MRDTDTSVEPRTKSSLLLLQEHPPAAIRATHYKTTNYPYHVTDVPLNGTSVQLFCELQNTFARYNAEKVQYVLECWLYFKCRHANR